MITEFEAPRSRRRVAPLPIAVGVILAVLAGLGLYFVVTSGRVPGAGAASSTSQELAPLTELYESLKSSAVDTPNSDELVEGAIRGMLQEIDDPYARYFPAEDFEDFNASLDGTFSGVGLMLEETPQGPVIVSVLEGTPAQRAGIEEGERIVAVNGEDVSDEPLQVIVNKVKGEAGTEVTLGLADDEGERRTLQITRAEFDLPLIESQMLAGDIGYIQLFQFAEDSGERVRRTVRDLIGQGARGIVLDLRGNPGGLLDEAVAVASVFIEDGEIVSVQERAGQRQAFDAVDDAFEQIPLAVLVDGGSASASEIVAGAIADTDRGTIVGQRTFGKGTVQTIAQLSNGSGAKFTTARYFTPSGDSIEGVGVKPEVRVAPDDDAEPVTDPAEDPQVDAAADEVGELIGAGR